MSNSNDSTSTDNGVPLSPEFLEFCDKVRNNDPSISPELGDPFQIRRLSEKEGMELADALLENTIITYLELKTDYYTKSSAEAMARYVRTSKRLQRIRWKGDERGLRHVKWQDEEIVCYFLPAIQESTSLKELHINFPLIGGPSNLALEDMLTHTQSLRSLSLKCPFGPLKDIAVVATRSGLQKNTTLRELTLDFSRGVSPIVTSLRDHPLLRRLCLHGHVVDLRGLETLLLSGTSKITELEIDKCHAGGTTMMGLTPVLQALGRYPTLTKLGLIRCHRLGREEARQLRMALCNMPSLQSLDLAKSYLGSTNLAELAPALYCNTSIKVLDISYNNLNDIESARLLRDISRRNKTMTALNLSGNTFGNTTGAIKCITDGLGSNSTLLKIDLKCCRLKNGGASILAQSLGSRNTTLEQLTLDNNSITSAGVGKLLNTMEQSSYHISDLDLQRNYIRYEGASLLARSLGKNALRNVTRLCLSHCDFGDDGLIALASALKQNTSLLQLDLRYNQGAGERAFLVLAESLPEIKVLQRLDLSWCTGLASAMPLVLKGLRENTSLFRFHVANCAPSSVPPTTDETARYAGGWMQEMECIGYRNRFRSLICAPKERLPPRGVWPRALARDGILPDVIFEVLRSKPDLVSEDTGSCCTYLRR